MSTFKKYPKIHRLGKEETEGILIGTCVVQEKIDGANAQVWIDKRGAITCGSRNRELTEGFNGLVDYVKDSEELYALLKDHPNYRLYGEWLVRHTIAYNELAYRKFYLFDITEVKDGEEVEEFKTAEEVYAIAKQYGIPTPEHFGTFIDPTEEALKDFVGKTVLGEIGEGIVIKNHAFRDKFGNHNYAKIVTQKFKEDNAITFGGNNKHSDTYWEMYIVNKYVTLGRVQKVMHKLEPTLDERLDLKHIPRIAGTVYHDMLTEEIWEIAKKVQAVDFKKLQNLAQRKAIQIYKDILNGDVSVADTGNIGNHE